MSDESSLKKHDSLADRIRQHRQAVRGPVLVVEGVSDRTTLQPVLPGVSIFPAGNRRVALDESHLLHQRGTTRWACIVDLDFDDEVASYDLGGHLHPYVGADLEAMLVMLGVLHDLIEHLGSEDKIAREGGIDAVVNQACKTIFGIACLRKENAANGWGLPFDTVPIEGKIDLRTLQFNVRGYCTALRPRTAIVDLQTLIEIATQEQGDEFHFSGKDVVAAVSVALRRRVGSLKKEQVNVEVLEASLRAASAWRLSTADWLSQLKTILQS